MGYHMNQRKDMFFIDKENKEKTLQAIKDLAKVVQEKGSGCSTDENGERTNHFAWVSTTNFVNAKNLEEALVVWRWEPHTDKDGNIVSLEFIGEKSGDDMILFVAIAPYVKNNSYIEMQGEDDAIWRWVFNNGNVKEICATISFND